jgi:hypothetical protein
MYGFHCSKGRSTIAIASCRSIFPILSVHYLGPLAGTDGDSTMSWSDLPAGLVVAIAKSSPRRPTSRPTSSWSRRSASLRRWRCPGTGTSRPTASCRLTSSSLSARTGCTRDHFRAFCVEANRVNGLIRN